MTDLERELRALPVAWPPTPDLVGAVAPRLLPRRRTAWRRWLAGGGAALALAAAVEPARTAVLDVLGVAGGEEVRRVQRPPAAPPGDVSGRGTAARSLAAARAAVRFPVRVPTALGDPAEVRVDRGVAGGAVTLRWPQAALTALRGDVRPFAAKLAGPGTSVRDTTVAGAPAVFMTGAPRTWVALDRAGVAVERTATRVDADVLLFDAGGVAYRLELPRGTGLARARAIAASLGR